MNIFRRNKQQLSIDGIFNEAFLKAEAAYQYQREKIGRYALGDEVTLGKIVDFLLNTDVTDHLTGLSVCPSRINGDGSPVEYVSDAKEINDFNILKLLTREDDSGDLHPLTAENVTMTVLRDNGLPVVLFFNVMDFVPGMLYIRIYGMVNGTNDDDDLKILDTANPPLINSTLISCRASNDDLSEKMALYKHVEAEVREKMERREKLDSKLQERFLEGMFGRRLNSEYSGYGDWLYLHSRYYDAQRQYLRLINSLVSNPAGNFEHGDFYAEVNYKMANCLLHTKDAVSAFHYMDIANFFNDNISTEHLMTLAKLADCRFRYRLNDMAETLESEKIAELNETYDNSVKAIRKQAEKDLPYLSLGFVLSQLLRVEKYNVFSLHVFRYDGNGFQYERIDDREEYWNRPISDFLQDGNTIVIGYSRTEYDCKLEDDHSLLCAATSIVMHADKIMDRDLLRVNAMIPAFIFDPDKIALTNDYSIEYQTFIISPTPHVFDFTMEESEIMSTAEKLYTERRTLEALLGFLHTYNKLLPDYYVNQEEKQYQCFYAAARVGVMFLDLDLPYVADYYLNLGLQTGMIVHIEEYLNCLINYKDVRAMSLIDSMLLGHPNLDDEDNRKWKAFLRRRKAYLLIDWGLIPQAKELLHSLLGDPLCREFAVGELQYLKQNGL